MSSPPIDATRTTSPSPANICAVIVSYKPNWDHLREHIKGISAQTAAVVVVDNGSGPDVQRCLSTLTAEVRRLHIVPNSKNLGIATALNQGVNWATDHGFDWALLLDQDSELSLAMVEGLCSAYAADDRPNRLAALGANFEMRHLSGPAIRVPAGKALQNVVAIATSGTLLRLAAFGEVGPFRDEFFIDSVDNEYCIRLRAANWRVAITAQPLMRHSFGDARAIHVFGYHLSHTNHSPLRRYYGTRNGLVVIREYIFSREFGWTMTQIRRLIQEAALITLFEANRRAKLKAMALGAWHFLCGRSGKLPPERLGG